MHLDEERLQRMLHDELAPPERAAVVEHISTCEACLTLLDREGRDEARVFEALAMIDSPAPLRVLALDARAHAKTWRTRLVAAIGAITIAGIAYAAPDSPLRAFLHRSTASAPARVPADSLPVPRQVEATSGIAVSPGARLAIDIASVPESIVLIAAIADEPADTEVVLRAVGGHPSFQSDVDRVAVRELGDVTSLAIEIPRAARYVEVRLGGRPVFIKTGAEITTAALPDSAGRYILGAARAGRTP